MESQEHHWARVLKIKSPYHYVIRDCRSKETIWIELDQTKKEEGKNSFYQLIKDLAQGQIQYSLMKKSTHHFKDEYRKGIIFLKGQNILSYYKSEQKIDMAVQGLDKIIQQIIECYVVKVEGLKLTLCIIETNTFVSFYFSELKLPKPSELYAKKIWQRSQEYLLETLQGEFVQIKVNGTEKYREQVNIYGQILRRGNGQDLKEKIVADGYAELSKNGEKYLPTSKVELYKQLTEKAMNLKLGLWQSQKKSKAVNQGVQLKYKQWEEWYKQKKQLKQLKNWQQELKLILEQFKRQSSSKVEPNKNRQLVQIFMCLFQDSVTKQNINHLEEFLKLLTGALVNYSGVITNYVDNSEFLKFLNKAFTCLIFYLIEYGKIFSSSNANHKQSLTNELEKVVKFVFKMCFIGNETFHEKIFCKKKENDYECFSFETAYLQGGISSYSECSDIDDFQRSKDMSKNQKKLSSTYSKIRINSTLLLSLIFKFHPSIVQNHWKICVTENVLNQQFFVYLKKISISAEQVKISSTERQQVANLMRTNFGEHSLILLLVFQPNPKVKMNALSCIINMIINFQGKRMIDTTQKVYIQKLLKQTKSSFVPKSFIIFSGLRNALYFMLFSLHYEKNVQIIMQIFKALSELCFHSTLMDKMGFVEGMGLLMENYIAPVLQFPWEVTELRQLKILCVSFMGVLVSTQKKWPEIQNQYLICDGPKNINKKLLQLIEVNKEDDKAWQQYKTVVQITKYFTKLAKRYYSSLFYIVYRQHSVWSYLSEIYLNRTSIHYVRFVEEVLKCHFDQLRLAEEKSTEFSRQQQRQIQLLTKSSDQLGQFINKFVTLYSSIVTSQNYTALLSIMSYVDYPKWSDKNYSVPKKFIQHCFDSLLLKPVQKEVEFTKLDNLKDNSFVRLALIKLIGYMSFCEEFQKQPYPFHAFNILLDYSRNNKSLNAIVKITWGLSNWAKLPNFSHSLSKTELSQCLQYLIAHSRSDKEKIASNCTRGIGFFINNVNKEFDLGKCRQAVINNLSHSIIKVRTNSTKTLRTMAKQIDPSQIRDLVPTLQANLLKNNYHLQTQTLHLIKDLGTPISKEKLLLRYSQILNDLNSHTTMEYEFSEVKAIKHLRKVILQQVAKMPTQLTENTNVAEEVFLSIISYLQQCKEESTRKQTKGDQKLLSRGLETGQQAENQVFNIQNSKQYNEEKTIMTKATLNAMNFHAEQKDIHLILSLRNLGKQLVNQGQNWQHLGSLNIQGTKVSKGLIQF